MVFGVFLSFRPVSGFRLYFYFFRGKKKKKKRNVQEDGAVHHLSMVRYPLEEETVQFGKQGRHLLVGKSRQHQWYLAHAKKKKNPHFFSNRPSCKMTRGDNSTHLDPFEDFSVLCHLDAFTFSNGLECPFLILYPIHQLFALFVEPIHPAAFWLLPKLQPRLGAFVERFCDE